MLKTLNIKLKKIRVFGTEKNETTLRDFVYKLYERLVVNYRNNNFYSKVLIKSANVVVNTKEYLPNGKINIKDNV